MHCEKYFFQSISCISRKFNCVNYRKTYIYTFCSLLWNLKTLKIDFQNFLVREKVFYRICFHAWLILLLSITSAKIKRKMQLNRLQTANIKLFFQKQPSSGVLRKRCSENMRQIYRRTPMPRCDFNKVTRQRVNINSNFSDWYKILLGVPQGSILGSRSPFIEHFQK